MARCDYCVKDLGPVVEKNACLSLMHSERPTIVYSFGISECSRVNKVVSE